MTASEPGPAVRLLRAIALVLALAASLSACIAAGETRAKEPVPPGDSLTPVRRGVNIFGAEFGVRPGMPWPGRHGTEYIYPHLAPGYDDSLAYFASAGMDVVRLPFRWERLQPELYSAFDALELDRLVGFLDAAWSHGLRVIIDPHNYGRYCLDFELGSSLYCGEDRLIGMDAVPYGAFADFWRRLAAELSGHPGLYAYGLMNEPTYLRSDLHPMWPVAAQAAVDAIRDVDQNTLIMVPGNEWSGAWRWHLVNPGLENVSDPQGNLVFEAHQYFDSDGSGTYQGSYDAEGAYPEIGGDRLQPFIEWLELHDERGFIGEFGVPEDDAGWLAVLDNFLAELDARCIGATYWAAGPWNQEYLLSVEPTEGTERPQMDVLRGRMGFECE